MRPSRAHFRPRGPSLARGDRGGDDHPGKTKPSGPLTRVAGGGGVHQKSNGAFSARASARSRGNRQKGEGDEKGERHVGDHDAREGAELDGGDRTSALQSAAHSPSNRREK